MKKLQTLASLALVGIILSGCSAGSDISTPKPDVTASIQTTSSTAPPTQKPSEKPSASASKSVEPRKVSQNQIRDTPLGIDIEESLEKYSEPEVIKYAKEHDVKRAMRVGLSVYADLISMENLYMARDASEDFEIIENLNSRDLISDRLLKIIEKSIKDDKRFSGVFTVDKDAKFSYEEAKGKHISYTLTGVPKSTFNTPGVYISDKGQLVVNGWRYLTIPTDKGTYEMKMNYWVAVDAKKGEEFKVDSLGFKIDMKKDWKRIGK